MHLFTNTFYPRRHFAIIIKVNNKMYRSESYTKDNNNNYAFPLHQPNYMILCFTFWETTTNFVITCKHFMIHLISTTELLQIKILYFEQNGSIQYELLYFTFLSHFVHFIMAKIIITFLHQLATVSHYLGMRVS